MQRFVLLLLIKFETKLFRNQKLFKRNSRRKSIKAKNERELIEHDTHYLDNGMLQKPNRHT